MKQVVGGRAILLIEQLQASEFELFLFSPPRCSHPINSCSSKKCRLFAWNGRRNCSYGGDKKGSRVGWCSYPVIRTQQLSFQLPIASLRRLYSLLLGPT